MEGEMYSYNPLHLQSESIGWKFITHFDMAFHIWHEGSLPQLTWLLLCGLQLQLLDRNPPSCCCAGGKSGCFLCVPSGNIWLSWPQQMHELSGKLILLLSYPCTDKDCNHFVLICLYKGRGGYKSAGKLCYSQGAGLAGRVLPLTSTISDVPLLLRKECNPVTPQDSRVTKECYSGNQRSGAGM